MTPHGTNDSPEAQQLQELENKLIEVDQTVEALRAEVIRLQRAIGAQLSWGRWVRHHIRMALGLDIRLGRLNFPGKPRPLSLPARYYRKPVLTDPPLISVVTPSFNQGPYIERTLKSVLDQEYPRLQFVVQDGGSKDETTAVLDRYRDRLHHCDSRPDRGQSHAINLGFAHTSGEIMAYLNSDDLLLPGSLHAVAQFFQTHPEVDVLYGHRIVIDERDGERGRWVLPPHDPEILKWVDYIPQETLFWRRRVWERVGGIDENFRFAMDWDLLLRFQLAGAKFHRLGRFLGAFRVHTQSKTTTVINGVGTEEMARIRHRAHGRDVALEEIPGAVRKYLRRHVLCNFLYERGLARY